MIASKLLVIPIIVGISVLERRFGVVIRIQSSAFLLPAVALFLSTGCSSTSPGPIQSQSSTYTVGGTASGLSGTGLALEVNGGDNLAVSANGAFTFATPVGAGAAYLVTIITQPSNPAQS